MEPDSINSRFDIGTDIAENTDLNTLTTPGQYFCNSTIKATNLVNCPIQEAFRMIVLRSNSGSTTRVLQIVIQYLGSDVYLRSVTNGTGTTWVQFAKAT